jgi:hypothetical protein
MITDPDPEHCQLQSIFCGSGSGYSGQRSIRLISHQILCSFIFGSFCQLKCLGCLIKQFFIHKGLVEASLGENYRAGGGSAWSSCSKLLQPYDILQAAVAGEYQAFTQNKVNRSSCSSCNPMLWIRIRRIRMFLGLPDPYPDPLGTCTDPAPDPSIIK